jgi:hypothetical protein
VASSGETYVFPEEYKDLRAEFQDLINKYPGASGRFFLADLGDDAAVPVAGPPSKPTIVECGFVEGGLECHPKNPQ